PPGVRVGIDTGEAVVDMGAREGRITGGVVSSATRLQTLAPAGGVVVGEQAWRATSRVFEYQPIVPEAVEGGTGPVPVWRALAARSRFGTDITRVHATPMVGREVDFTILRGAFDKAVG